MNLPKRITPCPIVESNFEVRFDTLLPGEAIFGIVYNHFKNAFPKLDKLPILQIPEVIRSTDRNLIHSPHYKLSRENYILQIGPKVFSLSNINCYVGWDLLFEKIIEVFKQIYDLKIIENITRLGLRYINLFPEINIYEKSDLKIIHNDHSILENINLHVILPSNGFNNALRMMSNAKLSVATGILTGSVIDIDTTSKEITPNISNIEKLITDAHVEEKKLFFSLLKEEYIKTLNPEY